MLILISFSGNFSEDDVVVRVWVLFDFYSSPGSDKDV